MARIFAKALNATPDLERGGGHRRGDPARRRPRRHRDRRRLQPRRPGSPRPHRQRRPLARPLPLQDLHHRRSAHAHARGVQRPAQDHGGAAGPRQVHPVHHRAAQGAGDDPEPLPALRFPAASPRRRSPTTCSTILKREGASRPTTRSCWQVARLGNGSMRDALQPARPPARRGGEALTLKLLEEMLGLQDQTLVIELMDAVIAQDPRHRPRAGRPAARDRGHRDRGTRAPDRIPAQPPDGVGVRRRHRAARGLGRRVAMPPAARRRHSMRPHWST